MQSCFHILNPPVKAFFLAYIIFPPLPGHAPSPWKDKVLHAGPELGWLKGPFKRQIAEVGPGQMQVPSHQHSFPWCGLQVRCAGGVCLVQLPRSADLWAESWCSDDGFVSSSPQVLLLLWSVYGLEERKWWWSSLIRWFSTLNHICIGWRAGGNTDRGPHSQNGRLRGLGLGLRVRTSNQVPGDAAAARPSQQLWGALV